MFIMKKEEVIALIQKYQDGECTPEEVNFLEEWFNVEARKNVGTPIDESVFISHEAGRELILSTQLPVKTKRVSIYKKYRWLGYAASLAICLAGLYLLNKNLRQDINPGGNMAILTLASGKKINLTDAKNGQLVVESGLQITKSSDGQLVFKMEEGSSSRSSKRDAYNTIETPKGGQYIVLLPDGSKVWLNAASTLSFPTTFDVTRNVELSGEAYFEVTKDKAHPFVVKSSSQSVTVLGTHFNISNYADDAETKTTLLEGSVKVHSAAAKGTADLLLKPGEETVLSGNSFLVQKAASGVAVAWKDNLFKFNDERLESILVKVARWYNVSVYYDKESLKDQKFSGSISKFTTISKVLKKLEIVGSVHFKIEGRRIIVKE
ncbi:FecR family protein [Pedobacter westerhofensis]|uniref:FecR family protein n=1 Tax=Pedobacter westerhofensis TaxID=425512 RepID=A0A521EAR7_9SPHI|nr:FecR domain-containing protein [Pedobacter westerhofensis]SMO81038.1 FecR family protein [Pedobacter westerhofensis]